MLDPPGTGPSGTKEVGAGLPRAHLASCPMQEPATCEPAGEEVKSGGAGGLQTAGYCQGPARVMAASLLSWVRGALLPHCQ